MDEQKLYANYNLIKLERNVSEKTIILLEKKMEKLMGGPKNVTASTYEEKASNSASVSAIEIYKQVIELRNKINEEKLYLIMLDNLLYQVKEKIAKYMETNNSSAELTVFNEHWINGRPLSELVVKKDRGYGYLEYRQIKRINRKIKEKIEKFK